MSNSLSGSIQASVNLTTIFDTGTAGSATEVNKFGGAYVPIGPGFPVGQRFTAQWSHTYMGLTGTTTIDLTALPGLNGGSTTIPAVRFIYGINSDPTAGHDVRLQANGTNGFAGPWGAGYAEVPGGMSGAGVTNGVPTGNTYQAQAFTATGWAVSGTSKSLDIVVPSGTVSSFTLLIAG